MCPFMDRTSPERTKSSVSKHVQHPGNPCSHLTLSTLCRSMVGAALPQNQADWPGSQLLTQSETSALTSVRAALHSTAEQSSYRSIFAPQSRSHGTFHVPADCFQLHSRIPSSHGSCDSCGIRRPMVRAPGRCESREIFPASAGEPTGRQTDSYLVDRQVFVVVEGARSKAFVIKDIFPRHRHWTFVCQLPNKISDEVSNHRVKVCETSRKVCH